tara:strand:+ start:86 stop:331 length:246 start_codon:yes stop_codon:yes gene_type:complete
MAKNYMEDALKIIFIVFNPFKILYFCSMLKPRIEIDKDDFYLTEQGYKVFTEKYHLKRGHCCKNGCKHCPYGYDKKTDSFK